MIMILELSLCQRSEIAATELHAWTVFFPRTVLKTFGRSRYSNRTVMKIQLLLLLIFSRCYTKCIIFRVVQIFIFGPISFSLYQLGTGERITEAYDVNHITNG